MYFGQYIIVILNKKKSFRFFGTAHSFQVSTHSLLDASLLDINGNTVVTTLYNVRVKPVTSPRLQQNVLKTLQHTKRRTSFYMFSKAHRAYDVGT